MSRRVVLTAALLAALAGTMAPARARAADAPAAIEQARTYFNAGAQAYEAGRFSAAVQAFRQAYALAPRPAILFSMAQAERKAWYVDKHPDDLKHAIEHYHAYLDQVPTGGRRADAADGLAELEPIAARLAPQQASGAPSPAAEAKTRLMVTSSTPGAKASLDGGPAADVPLIDDVTPTKHHVRVWADGYFDEERDAIAVQGSLVALDVPLREKPALLTVATEADASVFVDGRPIATTPLRGPIELPAGTHLVAITKNGRKAFTREVALARGQATTLPVKLESSGQRKAAWVVLGAGGAALVAGGVFTALALVEQGDAQRVLDAQAKGNISQSDVDAENSALAARDRWRTAAIASFGGAAGLALIGGALYVFDRPSVELGPPPPESPRPSGPAPQREPLEMGAAPWLAPGGGGLSVAGRW
jgi:tetratricopeptide (TPR) repeat protein